MARKPRRALVIATIGIVLSLAGILRYRQPVENPARWFDATWSAFQKNQIEVVRERIQHRPMHPATHAERQFFEGALLLRKGQLDAALNCFRRTPPQGHMRHAVLLLTGECHY